MLQNTTLQLKEDKYRSYIKDTGYYLGKDTIYEHIYKTGNELTELLTRKRERRRKQKNKKNEKVFNTK